MRVLVSRVKEANVKVDGEVKGSCKNGLLILSCFTEGDIEEDLKYLAKKCVNLRIFDDEDGTMNKSILDTNGEILSISQFTLYADAKKGNRPSYIKALRGEESKKLYEDFNEMLKSYIHTETGIFGADMQISAIHDGPVNIIIDSK
ncbi:MAG: D-tyrosyl-tRNA(Tyr) deacylase [Bacilli bacterium]|nr:D-tyrosyl-tRNA(Tyr) deacylase [Bacilli bacterium]